MLKKEQEMVPLRTLFRTFNPQRHNQEIVEDIMFEKLQKNIGGSGSESGEGELAGSASDLQKGM